MDFLWTHCGPIKYPIWTHYGLFGSGTKWTHCGLIRNSLSYNMDSLWTHCGLIMERLGTHYGLNMDSLWTHMFNFTLGYI